MRVLVEAPPYPVDVVRELLAPTGAGVEVGAAPWSGDDVAGLLIWQTVTAEDMARLPNLRVIATCSVGHDHIDTGAAKRLGVWVCNVPDYCIEEMADSTFALVLALLRGVVALDRSVRGGQWDDHAAGELFRIAGTRLGVVGFGRIGTAVAQRGTALGMEVWAFDPVVDAGVIRSAGATPATLEELLSMCRIVSLHMPLSAATAKLIGARELALMPRGAFLIDTARAGLVSMDALLNALDSGALAGAALDVLPVEPPTSEHPAPVHPRLIVTPHAAWYSVHAEKEVYRRAVMSVRAVLEGREPEDAVVRGR
jgi:phosphoglycerate dehydrogenase-like enzyme